MNDKKLQERAAKRREMLNKYSQTMELIDHRAQRIKAIIKAWDNHPEPKPVGKEFDKFVYKLLKDSDYTFADEVYQSLAEEAGKNIGWRTGYNDPREVNTYEEVMPATVAASIKKEAETAYTDKILQYDSEGLYGTPEEHTRYCPDHPGIQMRRVSDMVYQCPISGDTYSYRGGHEVIFNEGVHQQTTPGWNESRPRPSFLDGKDENENHAKAKSDYDFDKLYAHQKEGAINNTMKKEADYFGKVTPMTRYCPDHDGTQMHRVADKIYQCPLDGQVYNYLLGFKTEDGREFGGGSVSEMTPDDPMFYQSPRPFSRASSKAFIKQAIDARGYETRFINDLASVITGNASGDQQTAVNKVIHLKQNGDERPLTVVIQGAYQEIDGVEEQAQDEQIEMIE